MDWGWDRPSAQQLYAAYHFVPRGRQPPHKPRDDGRWYYADIPHPSWRVCIRGRWHPPLRAALRRIWRERRATTQRAYLFGIALHAWMDSYAHDGFSGWREDINSIYSATDIRSVVPNIGHAEIGTMPDVITESHVWYDPRRNATIKPYREALWCIRDLYGLLGVDLPQDRSIMWWWDEEQRKADADARVAAVGIEPMPVWRTRAWSQAAMIWPSYIAMAWA